MRSMFAWCAGPAAAQGMVAPMHASPAPAEDSEMGHLLAARAAVARGDLESALRHFDGALRHAPGCAVAHLGRTVTLAGLGRADEASRSLQAGLDSAGNGADMAHQLSRLAAREGNSALAMDLLGPALAARPDLSDRILDDPAFRGLRDHPRLLAMMGRL